MADRSEGEPFGSCGYKSLGFRRSFFARRFRLMGSPVADFAMMTRRATINPGWARFSAAHDQPDIWRVGLLAGSPRYPKAKAVIATTFIPVRAIQYPDHP